MYIAVKGGERAIAASRRLLARRRRGERCRPALAVDALRSQLSLAVARAMGEGSLFDAELAALALKQAMGDSVEAAFLLRAHRTTLPRLGFSLPLDTAAMRLDRRVSSVFKDLPGGQLLGASFDYTQRLLDFGLLAGDDNDGHRDNDNDSDGDAGREVGAGPDVDAAPGAGARPGQAGAVMSFSQVLAAAADDGTPMVEANPHTPGDPAPPDITRQPPRYPMPRSARLQTLARADEGWLLGLAYSTQRGYAHSHPFAAELRHGTVTVLIQPDELDFPVEVGEVELTECQMLNQFAGSAEHPPQFTRGYGLAFGHAERRAMAMALVDRALRADELGELRTAPAQEQEFVLPQGDNVEASGFVQHLKLPHYVTFEAELQVLRALRAARTDQPTDAEGAAGPDDDDHDDDAQADDDD